MSPVCRDSNQGPSTRSASISRTPTSTVSPAARSRATPPSPREVGSSSGNYDPSDAGVDERLVAWGRDSVVVAGLQGDDRNATPGTFPGGREGVDFGMRLTFAEMVALAYRPALRSRMTHPTAGFGLVVPRPRAEMAMARRMAAISSSVAIWSEVASGTAPSRSSPGGFC